jgi:hypothetical protein
MYSHEQILNALRYLTRNKKPLAAIRKFIKSGISYSEFIEVYQYPEEVARPVYFGHKREPYYEGEYPSEMPDYKVEDLSGEELLILKSLENGKNEGDLYRSNE